MPHDRRAGSVDPAAVLALLDQGPATIEELRERLGVPAAPLRRTIRELYRNGRLYQRGDLIAAAVYYVRESDGFGLGVITCARCAAQRRPTSLPADDAGDAA